MKPSRPMEYLYKISASHKIYSCMNLKFISENIPSLPEVPGDQLVQNHQPDPVQFKQYFKIQNTEDHVLN